MGFKSFISSQEPGKSLYIFVWILAWVPANVVVMLIDTVLAENIIKSFDDWNTYIILAVVLETPAYLIVSIFVYSRFPYIKISKVVRYVYFFSLVSIGNTWRETSEILESYEMDLGFTSFMFIIMYFCLCLGFRQYFRNSNQW